MFLRSIYSIILDSTMMLCYQDTGCKFANLLSGSEGHCFPQETTLSFFLFTFCYPYALPSFLSRLRDLFWWNKTYHEDGNVTEDSLPRQMQLRWWPPSSTCQFRKKKQKQVHIFDSWTIVFRIRHPYLPKIHGRTKSDPLMWSLATCRHF